MPGPTVRPCRPARRRSRLVLLMEVNGFVKRLVRVVRLGPSLYLLPSPSLGPPLLSPSPSPPPPCGMPLLGGDALVVVGGGGAALVVMGGDCGGLVVVGGV